MIKKYNGSSWVSAPVKKYNGSSWVYADVKKYEDSNWDIINPIQYDQDLSNGLISYYNFEETSGTTVYDQVGSNNGTNVGCTINQTGKVDKCYDFDGVNDKVTISNSIAGQDSVTISAWVNLDNLTSGDNGVIGDWDDGTGRTFLLFKDDVGAVSGNDRWRVLFADSTSASFGIDGIDVAQTGQWVHLVASYNRDDVINLWVDGVKKSSVAVNDYPLNSGYDLEIGNTGGTRWFNGKIDEVGIWNRALSSTEVSKLYNNSKARHYE